MRKLAKRFKVSSKFVFTLIKQFLEEHLIVKEIWLFGNLR